MVGLQLLPARYGCTTCGEHSFVLSTSMSWRHVVPVQWVQLVAKAHVYIRLNVYLSAENMQFVKMYVSSMPNYEAVPQTEKLHKKQVDIE